MIFLRKTLFSLFVLLPMAACSSLQPDENTQAHLSNIQALLPGDYVGMTSRGEVYHSIAQLQVPEFGGEVFYHHISTQSLRGPAVQRKVYRFDESGKRMRSTVLLGSGDVFADAQTMTGKLRTLTEEQVLRFPDGCQFQWSSAADGFVAEVRRATCSYESPAFGGLVSPEMTYQLSRCGLNIREGIYRQDGSPVFPPSIIDGQRVNPAADGC